MIQSSFNPELNYIYLSVKNTHQTEVKRMTLFGASLNLFSENFGSDKEINISCDYSDYRHILLHNLKKDLYLSFFRVIGNVNTTGRKKITFHTKKIDGKQMTYPMPLMSHFSAFQFQADVIDVKQDLVVDSDTEIYTDLNPNEEIRFMFCYSEKQFATKEMVENEISIMEEMTQNFADAVQEKMEVLAERQDVMVDVFTEIKFDLYHKRERRRKLLSFFTFGIFGRKNKEQTPVEEKAPKEMELSNQHPDEDALDVGGYCKYTARKDESNSETEKDIPNETEKEFQEKNKDEIKTEIEKLDNKLKERI